MSTTRYKITLEYNGQGYAGWQRQPNALSVQQVVEGAIGGFSNQELTKKTSTLQLLLMMKKVTQAATVYMF